MLPLGAARPPRSRAGEAPLLRMAGQLPLGNAFCEYNTLLEIATME
jgi:hypothetical protein